MTNAVPGVRSDVPGGITALIHTKDEAARVGHAVRSVRAWCDEVVVVDMHSTDATREVAAALGARVVLTPDVGVVEPARAAAVRDVGTEWVMILDADEVLPQPLSVQLRDIARQGDADVVAMSWLNYFMGRPLHTTDWGPAHDRHVRFFRKGQLTFSDTVHVAPRLASGARVVELPPEPGLCVHHFLYEDFSQFLRKLDRYTDHEAHVLLRNPRRHPALDAVKAGGKEFARRYVKNRGYRDDYRAFAASTLMVAYRLVAWAKAEQLARVGTGSDVRQQYLDIAEDLVAEYEAQV